MSTTHPDGDAHDPAADLASDLAGAAFVRLVARARGEAVAALGALGRALEADGTPFQARVLGQFDTPVPATDGDLTVGIGRPAPAVDGPAVDAPTAVAAVEALDRTPDPLLRVTSAAWPLPGAGTGVPPAGDSPFERGPGVAVPVDALADGLAHSTLVHGPFSGDRERASEALESLDVGADHATHLDEEGRRRVASMVALAVAGAPDASDHAADAVDAFLRPARGGPFETARGFGDVLDATARERPGVAVCLALGSGNCRDAALEAWRTRARDAHAAVRSGTLRRYDGLSVLEGASMPVETVARLVAAYRAPEPATLVVGEEAALWSRSERSAREVLAAAVEETGGTVAGVDERARARFDGADHDFVTAVREAL